MKRKQITSSFISLFIFLFIDIALLSADSTTHPSFGTIANDSSTSSGLLIVAPQAGIESDLKELLDYRRSQGRKIVFRKIDKKSPQAIASLIKREIEKFPTVAYVLLVGNCKELPPAEIPNYNIQKTEKNLTILSDDPYGLLNDTGDQQLSVGRFPTCDSATLKQLASKTVFYEKGLTQVTENLFFLSGRQPADSTPLFVGLSQQSLVDMVTTGFIFDSGKKLPRVNMHVATAFAGPNYFPYDKAPAVLRKAFLRRPFFAAYAGHGSRKGFATFHANFPSTSIRRSHIRDISIKDVCGPFFTGGCSMLELNELSPSIGEEILFMNGGPVGAIGFTRINDDFCVMQIFEILTDELAISRRVALGDLVRTIKRRCINEPQRPRSLLVQTFMQSASLFRPNLESINYTKSARKNAEMLMLLGDPTTSIIIP